MFDQFLIDGEIFSVARLTNFLQEWVWTVLPTLFLVLVLLPLRQTQRQSERILTELRRRRG